MPPKPKYTKEEIVRAAVELVRARGADALTAREVGKQLGTSPSPIFTVFADMDELKSAVRAMAKVRFDAYMAVADDYFPAYKKRGMQWVKFAGEEPRLFELLFMQTDATGADFDSAVEEIPFGKDTDLRIIMRDYHATRAQAEHLFRQMWIYTYGLCALCAAGVCTFSEEEIAGQLGEVFRGMIFVLTSGVPKVCPAEKDSVESARLRQICPDLGDTQKTEHFCEKAESETIK